MWVKSTYAFSPFAFRNISTANFFHFVFLIKIIKSMNYNKRNAFKQINAKKGIQIG